MNGMKIWWISDKAFANKGITSVNLGNITDIGAYAFYGNKIGSLTISPKIFYVWPQAFAYNGMQKLTINRQMEFQVFAEGAFAWNCIKNVNWTTKTKLDKNLGTGWTKEQTCAQWASGETPTPTAPEPKPTGPTPTNPTKPDEFTILFQNFAPSDTPAVLNLDDPKLDSMKDNFNGKHASQNKPLTRGEFLRIVIDTAGVDVSKIDTSTATSFTDVGAYTDYVRYIAFATKNKIVSGYGDGTFKPFGQITRDEATKILVASTPVQLASSNRTFTDITPDNTLGKYVQTAYDNKLVNGINTKNGQLTYGNAPLFAPKKTISKWELFKIVYNIANAQ